MAAATRVLFLGSGYAGHRTRFENLRGHVSDDARIRPTCRLVSGWHPGGYIERLPFGSRGARGRLRALAEASSLVRLPRPDVTWISLDSAIPPWPMLHRGPLRRPLVVDTDSGFDIREPWAQHYAHIQPRGGTRERLRAWLYRRLTEDAVLWTPWSNWAAQALEADGVPDSRIHVLPPGVDLDRWHPPHDGRKSPAGQVRLLFVGGDFARKGGHLLLEVLRERSCGRFQLDIVTREPVASQPGVTVHRAEPNSPELQSLYGRADLFVMPSLAECFGIATVEAMASGLPVIVGNTGAGPEIVGDDAGWAIPPTHEALAAAFDRTWELRECLPAIGARARARAVEHFDGAANDRRVVDLLVEAHSQRRGVS